MLENERKEIDAIDDEIVALIKKRLNVAERIAKIKNDNGLSICDTRREEQTLNRLKLLAGEEYAGYIATIYRDVFYVSKEYQREYIKTKL